MAEIPAIDEILPPRDLSFELGTNVWEILHPNDNYVPPILNGSFYIYQILNYGWFWNWWSGVQQRCNCAGAHTISFKIRGLCYFGLGASTPRIEFYWQGIGVTNDMWLSFGDNLMTWEAGIFEYDTDPMSEYYGLHHNASYPGFDTITVNLASKIPGWNPDAYHYDTIFKVIVHTGSNATSRHFTEVEVDDVHLDGVGKTVICPINLEI